MSDFCIFSNLCNSEKLTNINNEDIASLIVSIRNTGKFALRSSFVHTKLIPQNIMEKIIAMYAEIFLLLEVCFIFIR